MAAILGRLNFNQSTDMQLVIVSEKVQEQSQKEGGKELPGMIRFQFFASHSMAREVGGVVRDATLNGQSIYLLAKPLNHLYYEAEAANWQEFFTFDSRQVKL
jgi:hypothetical protein